MHKLSTTIIALIVCGFCGIAVAGQTAFSETPMFAHADVALTSAPAVVATCTGTDGVYKLMHLQGQGPMTSTDPRFAGTFVVDAYILDNPNTGAGISKDNWKVLDPTTGATKVRGTAIAMNQAPNPIKGQVTAITKDGDMLWTMSTVTLPAPGTTNPIVIEYGGAGYPTSDRAVVVNGGLSSECTDPFVGHGN